MHVKSLWLFSTEAVCAPYFCRGERQQEFEVKDGAPPPVAPMKSFPLGATCCSQSCKSNMASVPCKKLHIHTAKSFPTVPLIPVIDGVQ